MSQSYIGGKNPEEKTIGLVGIMLELKNIDHLVANVSLLIK